MPEYIDRSRDGWKLSIWVQPGAKKTEISGEYQGCLKIRLAAPAVDNKANKALVAFMASTLKVKKNQVVIESGLTNRRKRLAIPGAAKPDWGKLNL